VLQLIHGSGWVHRDISIGNVYLYEGHGLLGDLEHAKNTADHSDHWHEAKMGTIDFMAVEVMELEFFFCPPLDEGIWAPEQLPFHYNAMHDIESAWWIGLWMLFFRKPKGHSESSEITSERRCETDRVFSGYLRGDGKLLYLKQPGYFFKNTCLRKSTTISKKHSPMASQSYQTKLRLTEMVITLRSPADQRRTYINLSRMRFCQQKRRTTHARPSLCMSPTN